MGKISEAQAILRAIGMPERQQTHLCVEFAGVGSYTA